MIISKTPMRMSFVGGGSDLQSFYKYGYGAVISTALNKYVYITVNEKFADIFRVGYSKTEYTTTIDEIEHNLVREALKKTDITKPGVDIVYMSDMLPAHQGSGLGASSSILVGTLHALYAFKGQHVSAKRLAEEACEIEIEKLGNPIGKQDQYAAAYGGFNFFKFNADETVEIEPIIFKKSIKDELNQNLLLFYTGVNTRSDTILTEQKKKTESNKQTIQKMVNLTYELRDALHNGDLFEFGNILHKNWNYKQKLASKITNPVINKYYDMAKKAGAIGGKILGSGGGGFLLIYCEERNQQKVRKKLKSLRETSFGFESLGSRIIYVDD
jgi:D-glycero-alpha-D-manno-heptose-7-phosphate kinase